MLVETGHAAKAADMVLLIFIDDLQHVRPDQFAVLISALHHCAHLKLPLTIVGAGLPQLLILAGEARSYAERLFDYPLVDRLDNQAAQNAIRKPERDLGVDFNDDAMQELSLIHI